MAKRFWEIDFLRGIAIVMMVVFHSILTLDFYGLFGGNVYSPGLVLFGRSIGIIFIFLVGVSLSISYSRVLGKLSIMQLRLKFLKRGLWVFFLGLLITAVSWLFDPQMTIWFGVLHLIGLSIIFGYVFLGFNKYFSLVGGSVYLVRGFFLQNEVFSFPWMLWLGLKPAGFTTYDYFPIIPYFGLFLVGIAAGKHFYKKNKRSFKLPELENKKIVKQVCFLGRHSLLIYLIHVPILLAVLFLLN